MQNTSERSEQQWSLWAISRNLNTFLRPRSMRGWSAMSCFPAWTEERARKGCEGPSLLILLVSFLLGFMMPPFASCCTLRMGTKPKQVFAMALSTLLLWSACKCKTLTHDVKSLSEGLCCAVPVWREQHRNKLENGHPTSVFHKSEPCAVCHVAVLWMENALDLSKCN